MKKILKKAGKGVYVIKYRKYFGRFKGGKSDIVYIGSSTDRKGLWKRIRTYFHPGNRKTARRINRYLKKYDKRCNSFKISFILLTNSNEVRDIEKELLEIYENDHGELPPWNRNM